MSLRLGTNELESASLTVDEIGEPVIDDLRGQAVEIYVARKPRT